VQLDAQRQLPLEDTAVVLGHLRDQRWHLQLPPAESLRAAQHQANAGHPPAEPTS
jgi:uncharacterized protein YcgL (UPF0745 family)